MLCECTFENQIASACGVGLGVGEGGKTLLSISQNTGIPGALDSGRVELQGPSHSIIVFLRHVR